MSNIYKINSDVINDDEYVVADDIKQAIDTYVKRYSNQHVTDKSITRIERVAEKCLISEN